VGNVGEKSHRGRGLLLVIATFECAVLAQGCAHQSKAGPSALGPEEHLRRPSATSARSIITGPEAINFGIVPQQSTQIHWFEVVNNSEQTVELDEVQTSCDCLEFGLTEQSISARGRVLGWARMNLSKVPHFKGPLKIQVTVSKKDGSLGFQVIVAADIRSAGTFLGFPVHSTGSSEDLPAPVPMRIANE